MLTIGNFLKKERVKQKVSLEELERKTKIRREILELIELEKWDGLPEYPVVLGFVKNISKSLKIDVNKSAALLRRDYPPRVVSLKKQEAIATFRKKFTWKPEFTFLLISVLVGTLVLLYILYQLKLFLSPPSLEVYFPQEGQTLTSKDIEVLGRVDRQAAVEVNGVPAEISGDGSFAVRVHLSEGEQEVSIKAKSRSGRSREIDRKVFVQRE